MGAEIDAQHWGMTVLRAGRFDFSLCMLAACIAASDQLCSAAHKFHCDARYMSAHNHTLSGCALSTAALSPLLQVLHCKRGSGLWSLNLSHQIDQHANDGRNASPQNIDIR